MRSRLHRDATPRHTTEYLFHRFQCGRPFVLQHYLSCFIQNAVRTGTISQVQPNGELPLENVFSIRLLGANLLHCRSLFCASSTSNIGSVSHPVGDRPSPIPSELRLFLNRVPRSRRICFHARLHATVLAFLLFFQLLLPPAGNAYAVLAHQALIDTVWETHLKPLLLARYPDATEQELSGAQAYAYGGSIVQDVGYYPHGSHFFSDLTHYVRGGDFVLAMLRDSQNIYDYAFALGALSHYATDNKGHSIGTNRAFPILYPPL